MKKINSKINQALHADFSALSSKIDYESYTNMSLQEKRHKNIKRVVFAFLMVTSLTVMLIPVFSMIKVDSTFKRNRVNYSIEEMNELKSSSFHSLNSIQYPNNTTYKVNYAVTESYREAMQEFAYSVYPLSSLNKGNVIYSPFSLYTLLNQASTLTSSAEVIAEFDQVLKMTSSERNINTKNAFLNNFYATSTGTTQIYNGLFFTNQYDVNPDILPHLTSQYCEAYQMDFTKSKDVDLMLNWIDKKLKSQNFITTPDLELTTSTALYLFSTLYYKNSWAKNFKTEDSYQDTFYGVTPSNITYMYHEYLGDIYDYGDFLICEDYYENGYKIKYVVPKEIHTNLFDVIGDFNLFKLDESKKLIPDSQNDINAFIIKLSLPKFNASYLYDFTSSLKSLGLTESFSNNAKSFNFAFNNLPNDVSIALNFVKQKNTIEFSEDGTLAKTISFASFKSTSAAPINGDTIELKLNQPFIYILSDSNELPLYVGSVTNL